MNPQEASLFKIRKRLVLQILFVLFSIGASYLISSFFWANDSRGGFLSWPATTLYSVIPETRKLTKHYNAGDFADIYLKATPYPELVMEVDYLKGYKPESSDFDRLLAYMRNFLDKPDGIRVIFSDEIDGLKESYSDEDIGYLEKEYRTFRNDGKTATLYFLFLNSHASGDGRRGVASNESLIAVFGDSSPYINSEYPFVNSLYRQEVLRHEFGHILGLVNLGFWRGDYADRGDSAHHSNSNLSVMGSCHWVLDEQLEIYLDAETFNGLKANTLNEEQEETVISVFDQLGCEVEYDPEDISDFDLIRGYKMNLGDEGF